MNLIATLVRMLGRSQKVIPGTQEALEEAQSEMALADTARQRALSSSDGMDAQVFMTESLVHEQRAANLISLVSLSKQLGN